MPLRGVRVPLGGTGIFCEAMSILKNGSILQPPSAYHFETFTICLRCTPAVDWRYRCFEYTNRHDPAHSQSQGWPKEVKFKVLTMSSGDPGINSFGRSDIVILLASLL